MVIPRHRCLVAFHLAMGMCTFGNSITCKAAGVKHNQSDLMDWFIEVISTLHERNVLMSDVLRFISNAIGLRVPAGHTICDSVQLLVSTYRILQTCLVALFISSTFSLQFITAVDTLCCFGVEVMESTVRHF